MYGIAVAAELVGRAPQNLRLYESRGLLRPRRSPGGTRLCSANDLERVREITRLLDRGLNLAGIASVLELQAANRALRAEFDEERRRQAHDAVDRVRELAPQTLSTMILAPTCVGGDRPNQGVTGEPGSD